MKLSAERVSASEPTAEDCRWLAMVSWIVGLTHPVPVGVQAERVDKYAAKTRTTSSTRLETCSFR